MGYLLWSSLRSDSSETGTITVHPIWKDGFAVCLSEISAVDVKGKFKHRFLGGVVGGGGKSSREGKGDHSQGVWEDLPSTGLIPAEKLFSSISPRRALKLQKSYLGIMEVLLCLQCSAFGAEGKHMI